jgi:large subunit ribosomal protein L10e
LEAARVATNKLLSEKLGNSYLLQVLPYPHVVLRENKMIFGAHADRLQDGMRRAFGKPIGTAARVKSNQPVIMINVNEDGLEVAKESLKRGSAKLPIPCRIIIGKIGD